MMKQIDFNSLVSQMSTDKSLIKEWDFITFGKYQDLNRIYYKSMAEEDPDMSGFIFYCVNGMLEEDEPEVEVICAGYGFYDGVRHIYFHQDPESSEDYNFDGYLYYPDINDLISMLSELKKLEVKYCRDAEV